MNPTLSPPGLWSLDALTPADAQALLATARSLKQAPGDGSLLKGKHVALLCERPDCPAADVFSAAARGLGARVTLICQETARLAETGELDSTARLLGRLYDAIECDGMDPALMRALLRAAAVPVSNVLRRDRHPTRMLADVMTMLEISPAPCDEITLCVVGDAHAPWSLAWRHMIAVTGIGVRAGAPMPPGRNAAAPGLAFVCDPQGPRCADGQPALLLLRRTGRRVVSLADRQVDNHRFVVQALLMQTIGSGLP